MKSTDQLHRARPSWAAASMLASLVLLLLWDASGLDLALARLAGGTDGFPWRDNWFLSGVLHQGPRPFAWLLGAWLLVGVRWPTGPLRQLPRRARQQWLASLALSLLLVNLLKQSSHTSCPWDLAAFGGAGDYLSHWAWWRNDGGPGHCFPAGHAVTGFAFVGGFFAWRQVSARRAAAWLWAALLSGLVLGLAQQLRGAHFMSHTLWTGWLCWTCAWAVDSAFTLTRGAPRAAEAY